MALHWDNMVTNPSQSDEPAKLVQCSSESPESSNFNIEIHSNTGNGILPHRDASKIKDLYPKGVMGADSRKLGQQFPNYACVKPASQTVYGKGQSQNTVTYDSRCAPSEVTAKRSPSSTDSGTCGPTTDSGQFKINASKNQERIFSSCDTNDPVNHKPMTTSFQTSETTRQNVFVVGQNQVKSALSDARSLEHVIKVTRSNVANPQQVCGAGGLPASSSSIRLSATSKDMEIPSPSDGSSVTCTTSSSSTFCPDSGKSSVKERQEKVTASKKPRTNPGLLLNSDCDAENAPSTTTATAGDENSQSGIPGNSKVHGSSDSNSHEPVSSSTTVNDTSGGVPDSSTSTLERRTPKKQPTKTKPAIDILGKIAALGAEPERQQFLENLFAFMEFRGTPITTMPVICRQTVDLFKLYHVVKERAGMVEVSKGKRWRDVASAMGIGGSTSAGFTLKRNYGRYLFPYECRFDRGDIDPVPLLAAMETPSRKESKRRAAAEKETDIELDENESSCGQMTISGQTFWNTSKNNLMTGSNWQEHPNAHPGIDTTMNHVALTADQSSDIQQLKSDITANITEYQQLGVTPSALIQSSQDSSRSCKSENVDSQKSEFQGHNDYALHTLQNVRSSGIQNGGNGTLQKGSSYAQMYASTGHAEKPTKLVKLVDNDELQSGFQDDSLTDTSGPQVKDERSAETPTAFVQRSAFSSSPSSASYQTVHVVNCPQKSLDESIRSKICGNKLNNGLILQGKAVPHRVVDSSIHLNAARKSTSPGFKVGAASQDGNAKDVTKPISFQLCQEGKSVTALPKNTHICKSEVAINSASTSKSEVTFPPDSIEAKLPNHLKRRILTHRDLGPVDLWQVMMSLRSGLISENTWALDVLSVLLKDDFTASAFRLSHLTGLLEVLVEHLRRYLIEIFGTEHFGDLEMLPFAPEPTSGDACSFTKSQETLSTKCVENSRKRKVSESEELPKSHSVKSLCDNSSPRFQDNKESLTNEYAPSDWQKGHGDTTVHIITHISRDVTSFYEKNFFGANRRFLKQKRATLTSSKDLNKFVTLNSENVSRFEIEKLAVGDEESKIKPDNNVSQENNDLEKTSTKIEQNDFQEENEGTTSTTNLDYDSIRLFTCMHLECFKSMCGKTGEEVDVPDESLIQCWDDGKAEIAKRCLCVSNIICSLSLISGNETEMSRHRGLVLIAARLLLLHHRHRQSSALLRREAEAEDGWWWLWETLVNLREHNLVILANISGQLDLAAYPESICLPLLDGLLHWSICQSAEAQDPLPGTTMSINHLVLETLCKLCVNASNVDLLIATPPFSRIVLLLSHLAKLVGDRNRQVVRELSLGLMSRIVQADSSAARALALERSTISVLIEFIENTEHRARMVANTRGIEVLHDFPETVGTSVDMICRAADVLRHLALVPANSNIFMRYRHRFLQLIMSQMLDCKVTAILADVLGIISSS